MRDNREARIGLIFALSAFFLWGLFPVYFKAVKTVPPLEVLAHRIVWSVLVLSIVLAVTRRWRVVFQLKRQQIAWLFVSAVFVSVNWLIFIWAVGQGRVLETSLGYFINPLISVLLGVVFLHEKLRRWQQLAILLALLGVLNQILWVGTLPWVAFGLAVSFGVYGLLRKMFPVQPVIGLFLETVLLAPFALTYLFWLDQQSLIIFLQQTIAMDVLLVSAGLITTIPLLLFTASTQRLSLTIIGVSQYTVPTMTFFLAIFLYHEPFDVQQLITFVFIWAGIIVFTVEGFYMQKRQRAKKRYAEEIVNS